MRLSQNSLVKTRKLLVDIDSWRACDRAAAEAGRAGALAGGVRSGVQRRLRQQLAQVPCAEQPTRHAFICQHMQPGMSPPSSMAVSQ